MKILFVSNRLPIAVEQNDSKWSIHQASGGLVTALVPLLKRWGGIWIGWPGVAGIEAEQLDRLMSEFTQREGYRIAGVPLAEKDYEDFYEGFCNQIIWPLFHDLQSFCDFQPEYWSRALRVEQIFAEVVERHAEPDDLIWVQDYQLMGLGKALLGRGIRNKIAFFLHTPFPPPDIFCKLPWRKEVLKALLHYDVIGLQTMRDLKNFSDCVNWLLPEVVERHTSRQSRMVLDGRSCVAGVFPIGIDFDEFADAAAAASTGQRVAELRDHFSGLQVLLAVDRLDYTKGALYRLRSFARALERYPNLRKKVTLYQMLIPSRETVPQYKELKADIEQLVARINGQYTVPGWVPIHHVFRHIDHDELIAMYRMADVALVTPLKDGMNLVCKEYCACQIDGNGALVLSEFAGASEQLGRWAILVNPYDIECVADAIQLAVLMTPAERRLGMDKLRTSIREHDVHWWLSQFLRVCGVRLEDGTPKLDAEPVEQAGTRAG